MSDSQPAVVVLLGMMGAGKSSVGSALSELTGRPYLDNDALVRLATGRAAADIDASDGEAELHRAEAAALAHALSQPGPLIAGAAAWVVDDPGSAALLRAQPAVVYLRAKTETLRARIGEGAGRRGDATDLAWLRSRLARRDRAYRELATITIDTDELTAAKVAQRIHTELLGG